MSVVKRTILIRVGVIAGLVAILVGYIWWHSSGTYQYEEVEPGILYRASLRTRQDYVNAIGKCDPRTIYVIGNHEEQNTDILDQAIRFGARTKIKSYAMAIEPGGAPSREQIDRVINMAKNPERRPVLVMGLDGERPGMVIAAIRLQQMKLPLAKVLELADIPEAPAQTTQAIRDFARQCAAGPATTQGADAGAIAPAPVGPMMPQ